MKRVTGKIKNTNKNTKQAMDNPAGCDCIDRVNAALEKGGYNTRIGTVFFQDGGPLRVALMTCVKEPAAGAMPRGVSAVYCPFCGGKYPELVFPSRHSHARDSR